MFPVPDFHRIVVVDASRTVFGMGSWVVDTFVGALRVELAKYHIAIVDPKGHSLEPHVSVSLGSFGPRHWQSVDVFFDDETEAAGSVRLPDTNLATLEVAAEPVAVVIARRVWGVPESPAGADAGADP